MLILGYDPAVRRSDPGGLLVRFEAASDQPITRVSLHLDGDGSPPVEVTFPVGLGSDGRYVRALAFKPTINGTWPLRVTAWDVTGRRASTVCRPGVAVAF